MEPRTRLSATRSAPSTRVRGVIGRNRRRRSPTWCFATACPSPGGRRARAPTSPSCRPDTCASGDGASHQHRARTTVPDSSHLEGRRSPPASDRAPLGTSGAAAPAPDSLSMVVALVVAQYVRRHGSRIESSLPGPRAEHARRRRPRSPSLRLSASRAPEYLLDRPLHPQVRVRSSGKLRAVSTYPSTPENGSDGSSYRAGESALVFVAAAARARGVSHKVNHIMIVMQENRSSITTSAPCLRPRRSVSRRALQDDHRCVDGLRCKVDASAASPARREPRRRRQLRPLLPRAELLRRTRSRPLVEGQPQGARLQQPGVDARCSPNDGFVLERRHHEGQPDGGVEMRPTTTRSASTRRTICRSTTARADLRDRRPLFLLGDRTDLSEWLHRPPLRSLDDLEITPSARATSRSRARSWICLWTGCRGWTTSPRFPCRSRSGLLRPFVSPHWRRSRVPRPGAPATLGRDLRRSDFGVIFGGGRERRTSPTDVRRGE